jgi:hypothetical protein
MNIEEIYNAFSKMIHARNIHRKLGIDSQLVRNYRSNLKQGKSVSLDLKLQLLQKAGISIQEEKKEYTRQDLQDIIEWYNKEGVIHHPDYAVHKYLLQKGKDIPAEHINNPVAEIAKKLKK